MIPHQSVRDMAEVGRKLGELVHEVVFLGGAAVPLLVPAAVFRPFDRRTMSIASSAPRPTRNTRTSVSASGSWTLQSAARRLLPSVAGRQQGSRSTCSECRSHGSISWAPGLDSTAGG